MSRLYARIQRHRQAQKDAAAPTTRIDPRAAPGDEQRLRLIPAIGRNAPGAIPGTRPDQAPRLHTIRSACDTPDS